MCFKSLFSYGRPELKFTALSVNIGDAFLLEKGDWKCLFDSGQVQDDIVSILNNKKIDYIDLAICSHNDIDHTGGLIGLLSNKSNITIKEIWLPGFWASITQFVIANWNSLDVRLNKELYSDFIHNVKDSIDWKEYDFNSLYGKESISEKEFNDKLSDFFEDYHGIDTTQSLDKKTIKAIKLNKILEILKLACQKKCEIRWFEPINGCVDRYMSVKYNFVPLNSIPVAEVKVLDPTKIIYALYLTKENKYSLTFEYYYRDNPVVRFSADSDCICQSVKPYKHSIIITAPHHGSKNNPKVYTLKNEYTTWVRTCHPIVKLLCDEFKNLKSRYCLKCGNNTQEVNFEYIKGKWNNTQGQTCSSPSC